PWSYVVASDAGGDVFFGDISAAPGLTGEAVTQCVTTPVGQLLLSSGIVVTDGARGDCMWTERMPAAQQPSTIRSDYVANSNNTYELPHLEQRLTGFSPVLGGEGAPLSLRASLGLAMISDRLSGSDGMGEPGFTAELARAVFDHNRNRAAEILAAEIAADCQSEPVGEHNGTVVDLTELCAALAAWDQRNTIASRGVAVFRGLWMAMAEAGGHAQLFAIPAAPDAPLTTPSGYTTDPAVRTQVRNALARVALALSEREIPFDAPWGEVHRVDTPAGGIPMPGGLGTAGVFDAMVSSQGFYTFDGWADSLGGVAADTLYGASYLHVVEFGPDGVRASGLLPYSQSTEPSSPWYLDQVPSWSAGEWFAFPYTEAEIAADPALTELLLTP
ncbi:MAG: penicillin acylase family protein, partial [Myxococcota bacterium]